MFENVFICDHEKDIPNYEYKDITVHFACFESCPCKHYVAVKDKEIGMLSGTQIYKLFQERDYPIPDHFKKYIKNLNL